MSNVAEYQSVPTRTINITTRITTTRTGTPHPRRRPVPAGRVGLLMLLVAFGIPLIIYGVFEYRKFRTFSSEPGHCRVKGYDTQQRSENLTSAVIPVWVVDIVEGAEENDSTTDSVILRPDVRITGAEEHKFSKTALEEASQQYAVGQTYPCYYRRQLLGKNTADNDRNNLKNSIQWKKPSRKLAFTLWAIGSALILSGIILLVHIKRR